MSTPRKRPSRRRRTAETIARDLAIMACTPQLAEFHGCCHDDLAAGWAQLRAAVEDELDLHDEDDEPMVGQEAAFLLGLEIGKRLALPTGGAR